MIHARTAALLAALLFASACGSAAAEPVVVDVWFHAGQGGERDAIEAQARQFNARSRDVQVDVSLRPEGDYDAFVREAGAAGGLPCLLDLDGPFLASYVGEGWLQPLGDLVDEDALEDLLPSLAAQGTVDGEQFGVGTFDSGLALWGNARYLSVVDARIPTSVEDAWTLDELDEVLADLQALPQVEHALDLKTNYDGEWFTFGVLPFVWDLGGDVLGPDGEAAGAMDGSGTVAALEWLSDAVARGWIDPAATNDDAFYGERTAALSWVGHWVWRTHADALGEDLVLLPAPIGPAGQFTGMGSWQWGLASTCEHPEAAATFLDFLLEPGEILRMTDENGAVPGRRTALARSELYGPDGPLRLLADQLTTGVSRPRPITPIYPALTRAFSDAIVDVLDGDDPTARLTRAARQVDAAGPS